MAALVVPDTLQVTATGTTFGQSWANVFGLSTGGAFLLDGTVAQDIADQFREFYADLNTSLNPSWSLTEIIVRDIRTTTGLSYSIPQATLIGTLTGDAMPPHAAICASHRTALGGRSYRGRTFLAGWNEAACDVNGQVAAGYQTLVTTAFDTLRANLAANVTGAPELAVVSRKLLVSTPITETSVDPEWDRQDRRKRG